MDGICSMPVFSKELMAWHCQSLGIPSGCLGRSDRSNTKQGMVRGSAGSFLEIFGWNAWCETNEAYDDKT